VDLAPGETDILAAMREKGRYNVRLSAKHGVEAFPVPPTDENLDEFMRLLDDTTGRDGFSGNSRAHYRAMLDLLAAEDWGGLFFAEKDGEVLATGIFSFVGKMATYYYGASTSDNTKRKFMPAYALQWRAMLEGKRRGCAVFDFLGIDDPDGKPGHLAGVTDFKMKFGPQVKRWPEARIFVSRRWAYRFLRMARWSKRALGK
jgi:lipid II:glycine glycyltransferase (peptidoglycan interpeptide bridge formation enzyme)